MTKSLRSSLWLLIAVAASACGGRAAAPEPAPASPEAHAGAHGEAHAGARAEAPAAYGAYVAADVEFVRDMIVHHGQALVMTALVPERAASDDIRVLAERIEQTQEYEIALMRRWLEERGEPVPDHAMHGGDAMTAHAGMAGMLSQQQLERLAAAEGDTFDRLFLEFMIQHHQGALIMVDELQAAGGGLEPQLFQIVSHIDGDQRAEIARMTRMLTHYSEGES